MTIKDHHLHITTHGRTTIIALDEAVKLIHLKKIPGLGILIGPGVRALLKRLLRDKAGVDVAKTLGISTKKVSRLKRALGIPMDPRDGASRTTAWRKAKEAEAKATKS